MRRSVEVEGGSSVTVQADDARAAEDFASFLGSRPPPSLTAISEWASSRGYDVRVSLPTKQPTEERTSR